MTGPAASFAKGILLGLGAAVPIGPVNVQIARLALRNGFAAGFCLGCGAVTVDVTYAVLTSFGVEWLLRSDWIQWSLRVGGVLFLSYLAVLCFRGEREAWREDPVSKGGGAATTAAAARGAGRAYATGLLMTLLNPMTLAFWFVAVPALAGSVTGAGGRTTCRWSAGACSRGPSPGWCVSRVYCRWRGGCGGTGGWRRRTPPAARRCLSSPPPHF